MIIELMDKEEQQCAMKKEQGPQIVRRIRPFILPRSKYLVAARYRQELKLREA